MKQEIKKRIEQIQKGIVPEGYKKTKVGIIPEDWEVKRLGEIFEFKNGINSNKDSYGKGVKFINVLDVLNNKYITYDSIVGRMDISDKVFNDNKVEYGDIVFQRSSETVEEAGSSNVYLDSKPVTFGGFIIRGKKKEENNPMFMNYILKIHPVRKQIMQRSYGSTRFNIGQDSLKEIVFFSPSMKEQQRIASILETWDRAIELKEKLIQEKQTQKKGLMDKLLSTKNKGWETVRVGEIFNITRGNVLAKKKIRAIRDEEYKFPVYSSQTRNSGLLGYYNDYLYENAITWTTDGANAGDTNFRSGKFYCTNVCGVLLSDEGYANTTVAEIINRVTKKYVSYVGNPKLMNNTMSEIKITLPPITEQQRIAKILSTADREIELLKEEVQLLKQQKKGLMQLLLTGMIRV